MARCGPGDGDHAGACRQRAYGRGAAALVGGPPADDGHSRRAAGLLITVLVVNQLLNMRQAGQRGHAVAAQAVIMVAQGVRTAKDVSSVIDGSGDRATASDSFRLYMTMLLTSAPVLISDPVARRFLEQAQYLGGVMARVLAVMDRHPGSAAPPSDMLDDAVQQLKSAAAPLLHLLSPGWREAIQGIGETAEEQAV